jgi:poly(A) polymerase
MREIWMMQPRFDRRSGRVPYTLIEQPRFRAGFDFLRLRADAGEIDAELAEWWEDFSLGTDEEREALIEQAREGEGKRRKSAGGDAEPAGEPAKKRRRRRRKPAGAGTGAPAGEGGAPPAAGD